MQHSYYYIQYGANEDNWNPIVHETPIDREKGENIAQTKKHSYGRCTHLACL